MTEALASNVRRAGNGEINKLQPKDRAVHEWYRFVLSFPPHLVRNYLERFGLRPEHRVLDPFCGTGTTLVECRKQGIPSVGVDASPMACVATRRGTYTLARLLQPIGEDPEVELAQHISQRCVDPLPRTDSTAPPSRNTVQS